MTRCAVLGSPIGHSLSPLLHRAAYGVLGLDWQYDAIEVDSPGLAGFIASLGEEWRGLSLTMPLKRTVMPLLTSADEWATRSGGANTVVLESGERRGYNTDVPGAIHAITSHTPIDFDSAVVLGGGATAASVLLALESEGLSRATLLVRDPSRAQETLAVVPGLDVTVGLLDEAAAAAADIVVSTIPAEAQTPRLVEAMAEVPVVFEVLYHPWPTPLAASAADRVLVTGLDLLVHQAALQVELMTGLPPRVDVMQAAGEAELRRRA